MLADEDVYMSESQISTEDAKKATIDEMLKGLSTTREGLSSLEAPKLSYLLILTYVLPNFLKGLLYFIVVWLYCGVICCPCVTN